MINNPRNCPRSLTQLNASGSCRGRYHTDRQPGDVVTLAAMSSFWSTIIGAAAAIAGGLGAALWQTRRADDIARRIRQGERREEAPPGLAAAVQAPLAPSLAAGPVPH